MITTETYSKQVRRWIERVRLPSAQCQACLSDKSPDRDFMFTCELCQSSIHSKHYGREIDDPKDQALDKWYCQRCRRICEYAKLDKLKQIQSMKCNFCPNNRGILRRVIYNQNQTIWLHPECYTWLYPIVFHKNNRRIYFSSEQPLKATGKFWVNLQGQAQAQCQICKIPQGMKIKCRYYTCQKYYHCSCAKTIGLIRDLQSMRFDNSETYIPPYCQQHLQKRIDDCHLKVKKYKVIKDEDGKASHFSQMIATYTVQLKNMQKSKKKYEEEEKIRKQMQYQAGQNQDVMEDLSFDQNLSISSHHPPEFYQFVFDTEYPKRTKPSRRTSIVQSQPSKIQPQFIPVQLIQEEQPQDNNSIAISILLQKVNQNRVIKTLERESEPQESEWGSSQNFSQEQDDQ